MVLFSGPALEALEAGRFRPRRRTQPAEPGESRATRKFPGTKPSTSWRTKIKRQKREARPRRHRHEPRLSPYLGQYRFTTCRPPFRFINAVGMTRVHHNPDSWEGWYWGRRPPLGPKLAGRPMRDLRHRRGFDEGIRDGGLLVFEPGRHVRGLRRLRGAPSAASGSRTSISKWSTSIRSTTTPPRCWAVSGSPPSRPPIPALALAIAHVWIEEGSLRQGVSSRPRPWASTSGRPMSWATRTASRKTPEWQETETGVPAKDGPCAGPANWGRKKTYLGAGGWGNGPRRGVPQTPPASSGPG